MIKSQSSFQYWFSCTLARVAELETLNAVTSGRHHHIETIPKWNQDHQPTRFFPTSKKGKKIPSMTWTRKLHTGVIVLFLTRNPIFLNLNFRAKNIWNFIKKHFCQINLIFEDEKVWIFMPNHFLARKFKYLFQDSHFGDIWTCSWLLTQCEI